MSKFLLVALIVGGAIYWLTFLLVVIARIVVFVSKRFGKRLHENKDDNAPSDG